MEKEKTVFFTGHRKIAEDRKKDMIADLYSTVCRFILAGYDHFICGGAVGFDTYAAECVLSFRERFPNVKLILALPCRDQTMKWSDLASLEKYKEILGKADDVKYMQTFYTDGCMHERNRWMADNSSVCIAFMTAKRGGTAYTYNYSLKNGLKVINLATGEENYQLSFDDIEGV